MLEITGFSHYDKLPQSRVGPLLCLPVWWRALLVVGWCFFLSKPLAWPVDGTEHNPSEHTGECGRAQKHPLRCYFSKQKRMELHWYMEDADKNEWKPAFCILPLKLN